MKRGFILPVSVLLLAGFVSFQRSGNLKIEKYFAKNAHRNASGAPTGQTGAPGESNCTSCHNGSVLDGSSENVLVVLNSSMAQVTSYNPGETYTVSLVMTSNPAKKGFQATALSTSNAMAGSFTAGSTTAISGASRKYANHKSASNTSSTAAWTWSWTAPASNVGTVTFYVASNKANNNGSDSGDQIYVSQHQLTSASTAGIDEQSALTSGFVAGYNASSDALSLNFNSLVAGEMYLNLVDLNGKSVFYSNLGTAVVGENKQLISLPSSVKNGMYVVNFFVNNNPVSAKIMVQR